MLNTLTAITGSVREFKLPASQGAISALTLTMSGAASYGPTAGTMLASDAAGNQVVAWPDTAALPAGTYSFSYGWSLNGIAQAPLTGTLILSAPSASVDLCFSAGAPVTDLEAGTALCAAGSSVSVHSLLTATIAASGSPYDAAPLTVEMALTQGKTPADADFLPAGWLTRSVPPAGLYGRLPVPVSLAAGLYRAYLRVTLPNGTARIILRCGGAGDFLWVG